MADINIGQISEALNDKLDIDAMNSSSATATGLEQGAGMRTVVEVSDKSLLPSWYRVYSDGWCEQGGYVDTITTVSFLKTFKDTKYQILFGKAGIDSQPIVAQSSDYTTSTFYFTTAYNGSYTAYPRGNFWQASGYIE